MNLDITPQELEAILPLLDGLTALHPLHAVCGCTPCKLYYVARDMKRRRLRKVIP